MVARRSGLMLRRVERMLSASGSSMPGTVVSAVDTANGKTLWRFKGADKGITNIALVDPSTLALADRDDLILLDAATGKRRLKVAHKVERAAFVLLNERGELIVGGVNEVAAFDATTGDKKPAFDIPFPDGKLLRDLLTNPVLQSILSPELTGIEQHRPLRDAILSQGPMLIPIGLAVLMIAAMFSLSRSGREESDQAPK